MPPTKVTALLDAAGPALLLRAWADPASVFDRIPNTEGTPTSPVGPVRSVAAVQKLAVEAEVGFPRPWSAAAIPTQPRAGASAG